MGALKRSLRWAASIALAAAIMSNAAAAEDWKQYSYPEAGFGVQFPAPPKVEDSSYRTGDGTTVGARLYSLTQGSNRFAVTVADFSNKPATDSAVVDQAVKALSQNGEIRMNIEARVNRQFGRQLSVIGKDGSRTVAAIFFANKHLYLLTATSSPPNVESGSGDANRFQQSLNFIGLGGGGFFGGPGGPGGPGGRRGGFNPQAFADCVGKSAGDSVQLATPGGVVAATCVLVARPNQPPRNGPGGDPPPPPPDDGPVTPQG
jgi:hypothetical protein